MEAELAKMVKEGSGVDGYAFGQCGCPPLNDKSCIH